MPNKQTKSVKDEIVARSFLAGSRWAKGEIASEEDVNMLVGLLDKGVLDVKKELIAEQANLIESSINRCAL